MDAASPVQRNTVVAATSSILTNSLTLEDELGDHVVARDLVHLGLIFDLLQHRTISFSTLPFEAGETPIKSSRKVFSHTSRSEALALIAENLLELVTENEVR